MDEVSPFSVGMLIALYERTVGYYATMIGINAYHQPGVEAGKKAAAKVLSVRKEVFAWLLANPQSSVSAQELTEKLGLTNQADWVFKILESLCANNPSQVVRIPKDHPLDDLFRFEN